MREEMIVAYIEALYNPANYVIELKILTELIDKVDVMSTMPRTAAVFKEIAYERVKRENLEERALIGWLGIKYPGSVCLKKIINMEDDVVMKGLASGVLGYR